MSQVDSNRNYRAKQKSRGLVRKLYFVTAEEHALVREYLAAVRAAKQAGISAVKAAYIGQTAQDEDGNG